VRSVECAAGKVWSVECGVWRECRVWSVKCVYSVKCGVRSVKWKAWSVKCVKCGV